jgi:hypothetical protein
MSFGDAKKFVGMSCQLHYVHVDAFGHYLYP